MMTRESFDVAAEILNNDRAWIMVEDNSAPSVPHSYFFSPSVCNFSPAIRRPSARQRPISTALTGRPAPGS